MRLIDHRVTIIMNYQVLVYLISFYNTTIKRVIPKKKKTVTILLIYMILYYKYVMNDKINLIDYILVIVS